MVRKYQTPARLAMGALFLGMAMQYVPQGRVQAAELYAPMAQAPGIAQRFVPYYTANQGLRVLGNPVGEPLFAYTYPAQYFEKGRIEDHRGENANPDWAFAYGLLTSELMEATPNASVSTTSLTYRDLQVAHEASRRTAPPAGFNNAPLEVGGGTFVPFNAGLGASPGYVVADYFWEYINRADLFPGGWLHDVGLPMTGVLQATVVKNGSTRNITMQAFERAVLSYDPENPADFQVERGNIGADAANIGEKAEESDTAAIQLPAPNAVSTLPLHIVARFKGDDTQIVAELKWNDGTVFTNTLPVLREDGDPIVVDSINWMIESQPPRPATPDAKLTLSRMSGEVLATQNLKVLYYDDPDVQRVELVWLDDQLQLQTLTRVVPKTEAIARAALEELLWGMDPNDLTGFQSSLPTPEEVLTYMGRQPIWGPRVTLRSLVINNGVATADFSREIDAYGGGSARVGSLRGQIVATLEQFPSVQEVRITVEGESEGILQP